MKKETKNLPATVPDPGLPARVPLVPARNYWAGWATLDGPGRALMMRVMTSPDLDAVPLCGEVLSLVNVAGWPDTILERESGELVSVNYTCLMLGDGRYVRTTSESVRRGIELIFQFFGEPPWESLNVKLSQRKARNNPGMYLVLEVVD